MQDQTPKDLEPFFKAAREKSYDLPEHARRRILIQAQALQPKPAAQAKPWYMPRLMPTLQGRRFLSWPVRPGQHRGHGLH